MRKLITGVAFLALSLFWACHLNEGENEDRFDLIGDPAWVSCDEVTVVLLDKDGNEIDVLFKGHLNSVDDLKGLSAAKYDGSSATIRISGTKDGAVCIDEKRSFEGDGAKLKVDTIVSATALPGSIVVEPDSITLSLGGVGRAVKASIKPSYADQRVDWRIAGDGVVSLTKPSGGDGNQVMINPAKIGSTEVLVISRKDSTKTGRLKVTVTSPSGFGVEIDKDSVVVFLGGGTENLKAAVKPDNADQKVIWSSLEPNVASIDSQGNVKGLKVGETYVQARSVANNVYASTHVLVKRDAPTLTIASKTGAPVNTSITFSPKAAQQYGTLVMFKWDLDGDGAYEDSTAGTWLGKEVDLPPMTAKYAKEGKVTVRFLVRDGEGNETVAEIVLDIGNQAPEITSLSNDTAVSIKDSVPFKASVRDVDGTVSWVGWDYENDGVFDDSTAPGADSAKVAFSRKYPDAGVYRAIIMAKDETGKSRIDTVLVRVELDRPKASAGNDTTVTVGAKVPVHVDGTDKYGSIVKREVRLHGSGAGFLALSGKDTSFIAPNEPGSYMVVARVTDDDGLMDIDSMFVTVILSSNADLANLVFSAGALAPAFKPAISLFTAQVAYTDSVVTITPTAKDPEAKIIVNSKPVASGTASDPVKLVVGSNSKVFEIIVTAPDGTQRTFSLSVARDPSADASLAKLDVTGFALRPAFASTTLDYADTVSGATAYVTLKPTLAVPTATLTVNDSAMASGTATYPMPLAIGENLFKVVVTSQSGAIKTTYTAKVIRRAQLVLMRSLDGKPGTLIDSSESVPGAPRALGADPVTGYHFVKWTVLEGAAVIKDSLSNPSEITVNSAKAKAQANFVINQYVIKASGNAGGSIAPSGDVSVSHGSDQPFTISVLPGYRLRGLTVDGANGLGGIVNGVYSFKAVSAAHVIAADFVKVDTLMATSAAGGSVTPAKIIVDRGTDTAFTVKAAANYSIKTLMDNGVDQKGNIGANGRYPVKADGNHAISATWTLGVTMRGIAGVGGSITPDSVGVIVDAGGKVEFAVTIASGYRLDKLLDNGRDSTKAASFSGGKYTLVNVDTSHTVAVTFVRQYQISLSSSGPGSIVGSGGWFDAGSNLSYTLQPGTNARIQTQTVDGSPSTANPVVFNGLAANHSISVAFIQQYLLSGTATGKGKVLPASLLIDAGKDTFTTVTPEPGWKIASVTVDGSPAAIQSTYPFKMDKAHTVSATFTQVFTNTGKVAWGQGKITPTSKDVDAGGTLTYVFYPEPTYRFDSLTEAGVKLGPIIGDTLYSFSSLTAAHNVSVWFRKQYSITDSIGGKGVVKHAAVADSGSAPIIAVYPEELYRLTSLKDNGVDVPFDPFKGAEFAIKGIAADHKISAVFTRYYTISGSVNDPAMGSITPVSAIVDSNTNYPVTITANPGYQISGVVDNSVQMGATTGYTIANISANHTIAATFIVAPYYKFAMKDTLTDGFKGEYVNAKGICVSGKGFEGCQEGTKPLSTEFQDGTLLTLTAPTTVAVCNELSCVQKAYFKTWVAMTVNRLGGVVLEDISKGNPDFEYKISKSVYLRPVYMKALDQ